VVAGPGASSSAKKIDAGRKGDAGGDRRLLRVTAAGEVEGRGPARCVSSGEEGGESGNATTEEGARLVTMTRLRPTQAAHDMNKGRTRRGEFDWEKEFGMWASLVSEEMGLAAGPSWADCPGPGRRRKEKETIQI
jgi:hypothetical protein